MREIEKLVIVNEYPNSNRFYLKFNKVYTPTGRSVMPRSHYVWLRAYDTFDKIPKGFILHHLDWNETNDDISNLALMGNKPHSAHHIKLYAKDFKVSPLVCRKINYGKETKITGRIKRLKRNGKIAYYYVLISMDGEVVSFSKAYGKRIETIEEARYYLNLAREGNLDPLYLDKTPKGAKDIYTWRTKIEERKRNAAKEKKAKSVAK